jgi:hypothetical protein
LHIQIEVTSPGAVVWRFSGDWPPTQLATALEQAFELLHTRTSIIFNMEQARVLPNTTSNLPILNLQHADDDGVLIIAACDNPAPLFDLLPNALPTWIQFALTKVDGEILLNILRPMGQRVRDTRPTSAASRPARLEGSQWYAANRAAGRSDDDQTRPGKPEPLSQSSPQSPPAQPRLPAQSG